METLIQFFRDIFIKGKNLLLSLPKPDVIEKDKFPLGAYLNEPDNRDIPYPAVGTPVVGAFPVKIEVKNFLATKRLEQGILGTCVTHAMEFIDRADDGILHSRRVPYVITRNALGWTELQGQGLPQREAAKTFTIVGTPKDDGYDNNTLPHSVYSSLSITQEMRDEANLYRFGGFAFPVIDVNGFKQALADGKMIAVTIAIDWSTIDYDGTVHPVRNRLAGFHEVVIGMSDDVQGKFRFANWWGPLWGTNGDGFIRYDELMKVVYDAISFINIPEDLKLRAKTTQYIFNSNISIGTTSEAVGQLQSRLALYGVFNSPIDRNFGIKTMQAVKDYQRFKGLEIDGKVGPMTRKALNDDVGAGLTKAKLDLWCEAIKQMEGAKPYRNNPGNIRYTGQQFAVNDNGFCKFDTYQHGYDALRNLLIRACSGLSKYYNPEGSLYDFYNVYAPASDGNDPKGYAEFVAKRIGVDPVKKIKTLLI